MPFGRYSCWVQWHIVLDGVFDSRGTPALLQLVCGAGLLSMDTGRCYGSGGLHHDDDDWGWWIEDIVLCFRRLWISFKWPRTRWQQREPWWQIVLLQRPRISPPMLHASHCELSLKLRSLSFHRTPSRAMLWWWISATWLCPMPCNWSPVPAVRRALMAFHLCSISWMLNSTNSCFHGIYYITLLHFDAHHMRLD